MVRLGTRTQNRLLRMIIHTIAQKRALLSGVTKVRELIENFAYKSTSTNANTLTNKIDELKTLTANESANIIIVNEVCPKNSDIKLTKAMIELDGYDSFTNNLEG